MIDLVGDCDNCGADITLNNPKAPNAARRYADMLVCADCYRALTRAPAPGQCPACGYLYIEHLEGQCPRPRGIDTD